jgi:hypothetical protein
MQNDHQWFNKAHGLFDINKAMQITVAGAVLDWNKLPYTSKETLLYT